MAKQIQNPRGTKDILPEEQKYWQYIYDVAKENFCVFGAQRIETPIFEFADLYVRSIGKGSDIIDKEMFEVRRVSSINNDQEEDESKIMVLRPEYTAGIMRAYLQNGMSTWPQPVKLWYWGPAFRYERPQADRYRIHHQMGIEVLGDASPLTDASLILLAIQTLKKLGLTKVELDINSIGCPVCRPKMKKKLVEYFQNFLTDICSDCNRRFVENPLRILDCKEEKCQKIIDGAPTLIDMLCDTCKNHFKQVLENLDGLQIEYNLNPRLVRGLDYYTRTVFEIYQKTDSQKSATILAGGRYDNLADALSGKDVPAFGFSAGVERVMHALKHQGVEISEQKFSDIGIIQIGDRARKYSLELLNRLFNEGFRATNILGKDSLKSQLRSAAKLGAAICIIIGQREVLDKTVIFKDMASGFQETIRQDKLVDFLKTKIKK